MSDAAWLFIRVWGPSDREARFQFSNDLFNVIRQEIADHEKLFASASSDNEEEEK